MDERGIETLVFGPMKPVGLTNPHRSEKPYAVVQLRQDNKEDTLRNMVGFQTKMKYGEQERIFRMIPGLEKAEFARLGGSSASPGRLPAAMAISIARPSDCWPDISPRRKPQARYRRCRRAPPLSGPCSLT